MHTDIVAVALCLIGSAFFSGSETALTSLPITRLEALREKSGRLTRAGLDRWANDPQALLITILVGNNLVNVLGSALATRLAYSITESAGLAWVVGLMTLFILIFGEITPKTLAQAHAQWIAEKVAPILYTLDVALRPITVVLGIITRRLARSPSVQIPVTEEDLMFMLRLAHRHAQLPHEARTQIESILRLQQTVAREVMVPRPMVSTVDASWNLCEIQKAAAASPHSRFPVIDGSPDQIVGVLHAKRLLSLEQPNEWKSQIIPPVFIPESKPLTDLLREFRETGRHMAIVLDEFGGVSGVVTLEDAIELVVGEIRDEFDREHSLDITQIDGGWSVSGHLSLRRLERIVGRNLEQPEGVDSVGGLVMWLMGEQIAAGDRTHWHELALEVVDTDSGRPTQIMIRPADSSGHD
ncbi:MAG: HlyC/CorC family transporter [bacterium]|nr:HlyC/CorC family transporter [bacterium]